MIEKKAGSRRPFLMSIMVFDVGLRFVHLPFRGKKLSFQAT